MFYCDIKPKMENTRIALTFGDAGENHVGMEMVGKLGKAGSGFSPGDLQTIGQWMTKTYKLKVELHVLTIPESKEEASVLIIRDYISYDIQKNIFSEMQSFDWDRKYYDTRRKKVLNKHARSNVVLLEAVEQHPDYDNKKGRIVDSNKLPFFATFKADMIRRFDSALKGRGIRIGPLICEGNQYFDLKKCGIGYHGDAERRKVICLSLGCDNYPMRWQWFKDSVPVGDPFKFRLNSGDVYVMSEKAVGHDWKRRSIYTLRHAAGAAKYLSLKRYLDNAAKKALSQK